MPHVCGRESVTNCFTVLGRDHFQASCLSRSWRGIQIGRGWHQVHQNQGDFPSGNWPWLSSNQNQGDVVTSPLKIFLFSDSDLIGFVCLLYDNLWQVEASIDHLSQYLVLRLGSDLGLVPDNIDGDEDVTPDKEVVGLKIYVYQVFFLLRIIQLVFLCGVQ